MQPSLINNLWNALIALLFIFASPLAESQALDYKQLKARINEITAANQSGDYRLACEKSRDLVNSLTANIGSYDQKQGPQLLYEAEQTRIRLCQNAEDQQVGQFLGLVGRGYICKGYDSAVKTCAPASDFRACLSRLGFNSQAQTMCK